jgi:hypothetical protein
MEHSQTEVQEQTANPPAGQDDPPGAAASSVGRGPRVISPQACPTCETAPGANGGTATSPSWVYTLGNIEVRFPTISVEKERSHKPQAGTRRRGSPTDTSRRAFQA